MDLRRWRSKRTSRRDGSCRDENVGVCCWSDEKSTSGYNRTVRNEDEGVQAEVVWTCHEERPGVCRKKGDGNGVIGKEKKREAEEKISRCSEEGYGGSWCDREGH